MRVARFVPFRYLLNAFTVLVLVAAWLYACGCASPTAPVPAPDPVVKVPPRRHEPPRFPPESTLHAPRI